MSSKASTKTMKHLPTIRQIAESNGLSAHHVDYVVRHYNIRHAATAGNVRVFDANAVKVILNHREDISRVRKNHHMIRNRRLWDQLILNWLR
jgi:Cu/Ag efflux protein CusF